MRALALAVLLLLAAPAAWAHGYKLGSLEIGHPWSRPAAKGMNGAGYLSVTNKGALPDRLVRVETAAAARVEIHRTSMVGGVMRMSPVKGGLPVPAGGKVELAPGGAHLMLIKLTRPLKAGEKVPAVLVFEKAGRVAVEFAVQAGTPAPAHPGH